MDNTASGAANAGGGLYINPENGTGSHVDLQSDTIAGNVADPGAGIALGSDDVSGGGTLSNDTIAGNTTSAGVEQDCALAGPPPQRSLVVRGNFPCRTLASQEAYAQDANRGSSSAR